MKEIGYFSYFKADGRWQMADGRWQMAEGKAEGGSFSQLQEFYI
ncbi:MAG: hypothetical protein WBA93_20380 [Microcoleaceae cyanobacterium]